MKSTYNNLIIYYFSGTGNARNAAIWFTDKAKEQNLTTYLISIDRFSTIDLPECQGKTLIGFFCPTHGFNLAPIMIDFILKFPKNQIDADVFILNTRAGMKLYKIFLPGLSGLAQYWPATILLAKGYKVVGMQPMDLPSNWISLHPGLRTKVSESIHKRCKRITNRFAENLLNGKHKYKAFLSLPFDIAIAPISIGYYFIGRFGIAKTFVSSYKCTNCGLCIRECPTRSIKEVNGRMYWKFTCESCMRCMNICPHRAIETCHGLTFVLWYTIFALAGIAIPQLTGYFSILDSAVANFILQWILTPAVSLLFVYIIYILNHYLMHFKAYNYIISYTSLTKLSLWRRYKAPKANNVE